MPDFRRGRAAIEEATKRKPGSGGSSFAPKIYWNKDNPERYVLFLNPIEDIPTVQMLLMVPCERTFGEKTNTFYEDFVARTDPAIGEDSDRLIDELEAKPRESNIAVAVELEAVTETVKGRTRPKGFAVKMREFDRAVRDDDGNRTDETETVVAPEIGFVCQSPFNFFNYLSSFDATEAPMDSTPFKIKWEKSGNSTTYVFKDYEGIEVDLSPIVDNLEGIGYLNREERAELAEQIADKDATDGAREIARILLAKRLDELADEDRYHELTDGLTESLAWNGGGGNAPSKKESAPKASRPSQRKEKPADDETKLTKLEELKRRAAERTNA
jgi:hypothetical protein